MCGIFMCCFCLPKKEVEADSAVFPDIPQPRKNMADDINNNNDMYIWSDVETEVFLDLMQRI